MVRWSFVSSLYLKLVCLCMCLSAVNHRCWCLVSLGKGMFASVVRNGKENDLCRGIDCRFSDEYIGEKADVVGYCLWCDSEQMRKAMESKCLRNSHVKKGLQFFYDNDDDVFRMALTRLPVQYRTYWPLKALGLSRRFYREESMKAALEDKNSSRYRNFIRELRAVFARDERLYNLVCESVARVHWRESRRCGLLPLVRQRQNAEGNGKPVSSMSSCQKRITSFL